MTARALHMLAPTPPGSARDAAPTALCGGSDRYGKAAGDLELTDSPVAVTCRHCMKRLVDQRAKAALSVVETAIGGRPSGAHASKLLPLDRGSRAIIERSIRGETEVTGPRWSSLDRALEHETKVVLDGAPVRSSSDSDRFGVLPQRSVGEVPTPAALAGREDVLAVRIAIERAARACVEAVAIGAIGIGVELSEAEFVLVLRWLSQGEPVWQPIEPEAWGRYDTAVRRRPAVKAYLAAKTPEERAELAHEASVAAGRVPFIGKKGGCWKTEKHTRASIAAELTRRHGRDVTERQVEIAEKAMRQSAEDALRRAGELRVPRPRKDREEETMAKFPGYTLQGWKQIATACDRSEDWCQKMAARPSDPLPVKRPGGGREVFAKPADLDAWLEAEVERDATAA